MAEIRTIYSSENESYTNLKKSSKPLVSVYTSTYNRGYALSIPFESLCNQTYDNFEWIIVDGGSNDDTQEIVENFLSKASFPIKYVLLERSGKHIALNRLFQMARGEYAIGLDSDDALVNDAIQKGVIYGNQFQIKMSTGLYLGDVLMVTQKKWLDRSSLKA